MARSLNSFHHIKTSKLKVATKERRLYAFNKINALFVIFFINPREQTNIQAIITNYRWIHMKLDYVVVMAKNLC